jgi:PAS domain S-box-containing protein
MTDKPSFFKQFFHNPWQAIRDMPLRPKLIIIALVITAGGMGGIALIGINRYTAVLTERVEQELTSDAALQAEFLSANLIERVTAMQAFAQDQDSQQAIADQNATYTGDKSAEAWSQLDEQWTATETDDPLIQARLESDVAHELEHLTYIVPDFAEAFITDQYGGLVAAGARTSDYYQADEAWWQAAYNDGAGGVYIGEPEFDESSGVIGVNMAVPVYDSGGQVIGVMRTTLNANEMVGRLQTLDLGTTGGAGLFLGEHVFSAHEELEEEEHEGHEGDIATIMIQVGSSLEGHLDATIEGEPSIVAYHALHAPSGGEYLDSLGWKVVLHQAKSEVLAPVNQVNTASLILNGVIVLISTVAAIFVAQVVAAPILKLTDAVQRFAAGDRSVRTESDARDEIGTLVSSFNTMAEEVDTLMTDVQIRSQELAERTRELEASQRVTFAASERVTPDELLDLVVNLIRDQFDLYHAQVYLVDDEEKAAVLKQSTGYAGRQLLTRRHKIPLDATSLVTQAIHTGEPVLVTDTAEDPNFMANPLLPETRAELVVPLKLKDEIIGVLDAQDRTPGRFGPSTIDLFQSMADQVAILLENSELLERISEQTESLTIFSNQLRTAAEIARRMGSILDPERLLDQTVEMLQSRFGLYHAHIYVLDETTGRLVMRSGSGEVGRVLRKQGHAIPLDAAKSLVARAARNEQAVLVNDTSQESDFMPNPLLPQTRSEVAIPLISGDKVMGVLDIQDDQPNRFSEADIDTFGTLAGQIGTALQTAGVFKQTQLRLQVGRALSTAQTEDEVLDVLIEQMGIHPNTRPSIFTVVPGAEELTVAVRRQANYDCALPLLEEGMSIPISRFPTLKNSAGGQVFVSLNLLEDETIGPAVQEIARQTGARSEASIPLMAGAEYLGVISVSSPEVGYFDEEKLHLYQTLAEQGATALRIARLNDEVLEREARFTGFAEASSYGFGMGELTGQLTFANPALLEILGEESQESACKKTFFEYYTDEDRKRMEEEVLPVVMDKGQWVGEISLLSSKGKLTPTEQNIFLIYDDQGSPRMVANIITDITERKRAQEEMQKLATVVTHSSELVNLTTLEGQMTFVNEAGSKMLGIDPDEVEQYAIPHVIPEKLMPMVQEELLPTLMSEGAWEGELQYKNVKTSEITDVHASTFIVTDPESGEPLYLANVSMDVTEQKKAQETLAENKERLDLAMEAANAGVWEFWPQDDKAFFNERWFSMLGYGPDELEHSYATWRGLLHPDDVELAEGAVFPAIEKGSDFGVDFRMKTKDGGWLWIHDIGKTVEWTEEGTSKRMIGTHTDINESKMAEMERERFTTQLRTAADLAEQVNAILDPDQLLPEVVNELQKRFGLYHVHVYTLAEPTAEQLANADAAEVARIMRQRPLTLRAGSGEVGQQLLDRDHAIALSTEKSLVARAARDQAPILVNDTSEDPDFLPNPLLPETRSEVAVPLVAGENVLGVLDVQDNQADRFTQSDIDVLVTMAGQIATALQNASYFEEVQRTAERLREVDRLKSEFLASMSHELRTPLNSIIGYTEIMLMGLDSDLDPEMLEDVQAIYDNGQHLLRIINDVLDLAKIEAGRLELNTEQVPVEVLIDAASSSVTGLLVNKEKPVEFNVEIEDDLPTIQGDQVRLNQVINNLASNAVKFTDEGHITMRAFRDDGWICLEVEDTGIGIAEEDLTKIFERFQQVDGSNARKQEGTGLGLAITRHLVQMHGGTIKVKSKLGKGATFTVRLPVVENGIEEATPEAPQEAIAAKDTKAKTKSSKKKKSAKAPAKSKASAPEAGVSLSPSDIVDMLLE